MQRTIRKTPWNKIAGWFAFGALLLIGLGGPALAGDSPSSLKKQAIEAEKAGKDRDAVSAVKRLAALRGRRTVDALLEVGAKVTDEDVYRAVIIALQGVDQADEVEQLVRAVTGSGPIEERIVGCVVCGRRKDAMTLDALIQAVDSRDGTLRRMATRAIVLRRDKAAIPALIDLLEKLESKNGSGAGLVRRALRQLTGKDLGDSLGWRSFWDSYGAEFELPGKAEAAAALKEEKSEGTRARFFGRDLDSDRIVFVIDVSGSMRISDPLPRGGRKKSGAGEDEATSSRVRLDRAKAELLRAIESMPKQAKYTILAYSGKSGRRTIPGQPQPDEPAPQWLKVLSKRMLKANDSSQKKAKAFIESLKAEGATFTGSAIEAALEVKDADLIVLLSDGAPTEWTDAGAVLSPTQIREKIRTANRFKRATIDTFGFAAADQGLGGGGFVEFMKGVAADSGGFYQDID
ncbi:MAG: VWA domain-containing protein [Planctomycetota bacterium]|jgi:hypothetical protein